MIPDSVIKLAADGNLRGVIRELVAEIKELQERTEGQEIRLDWLERSARCTFHTKGLEGPCIHCGQEFDR